MKTIFSSLLLAAAVLLWGNTTRAADQPAISLEQRIAVLEAYIANADPGPASRSTNAVTASPALGLAGPGHNAWAMTSTALVLFMTLPGLFLFYGGLVRRRNILSVIAQCFGIAGLVTILWVTFGYSAVFSGSGDMGKEDLIHGVLGGFKEHFLLTGIGGAPNAAYSPWVSESVFAMFQLMFAIITPALILGAIAERIKFSAFLTFAGIWMIVVYFPMAHMVWGINGIMNGVWNAGAAIKAVDFAGGTVVHMLSGWSALVLCIILGKRLGFPRENFAPHSMVLCAVGAGMLWVGWYGFNAGSALAADGVAANAFMTTTIAAGVASFVWPLVEWIARGKPSVLGFCSGAVAGLVVITPACGFVTAGGAMLIGVAAGIIPWFFCSKVKAWFGYDDALDAFGIHAIGGTLGAILTGMLARTSANPNLELNLKAQVTNTFFQPLLWEQLKVAGITIVVAVVGTALIALLVRAVIGLRPSEEVETVGLDLVEHGEEGYHGG